MVKDKSFGILLNEIRLKKNVILEQLGVGVCDVGKLSRIENGKVDAEKLLRDRLLDRLGVAEENYENFLYYSEYKDWNERQEIVHCILYLELTEAKQRLEEYKRTHSMDKGLEYQFYLSILVQIRRREGADKEEVKELFRQALELTVPKAYIAEPEKLLLSMEEINLLLEYAHYCEEEFSVGWYEKLFLYVEQLNADKLAMTKIYPKLVFYFCQKWKLEEAEKAELSQLLCLCNRAIEILQKGNRMFYLWELLTIKEQVLQALISKNKDKGEKAVKQLKEWKQTCKNWYSTLEEVYAEYGVLKEMQDFSYLYVNREAHCIGDVIRIRRKMLGMTMQQLSDGICSERTISRLERNETEPHRDIVRELFVRLKMPGEVCRTDLVTENPEVIRLFGEAKRKSNQRKAEESNLLLSKIRELISFDIPGNWQAIRRVELSNEWMRKNPNDETIEPRYFVEQLKEIMAETMPYEIAVASGEKYLTKNEVSCLRSISIYAERNYAEWEQCVTALFDLYENQRRMEECFDMYEFVMGGIASNFGNMGEYNLSDEISMKIIKNGLLYRRIGRLYKEKYSLLWNDVQRAKNQHPVKRGVDTKKELLNCMNLCEMCGDLYQLSFFQRKLKNGME